MMAKEKIVTINDEGGVPHTYTFTPRSAEEGVDLMSELSKYAPSLFAVYAAFTGDNDLPVQAFDSLAPAVAGVLSVDLMKKILKYAERDNKLVATVFSTAYQANYGELTEAVVHALTTDFGSLQSLGKRLSLNAG